MPQPPLPPPPPPQLPAPAAPTPNGYERSILDAAGIISRYDTRARAGSARSPSLAEWHAALFAVRHRLSYTATTALLRELLLNPVVAGPPPLGGAPVRVTTGETLRRWLRTLSSAVLQGADQWVRADVAVNDPDALLLPARRRVALVARSNPLHTLAAHLQQHAIVGDNFLLHPNDPEPPYDYYLAPHVVASAPGPQVAGAPFKAQLCADLVAAVTAAVQARVPPGETLLVVPLFITLDYKALSRRKTAAAMLVQPMNYVGPFARSVGALTPVALVGPVDVSDGATSPAVMSLKRQLMQLVFTRAIGRFIVDNHAAGGYRLGQLAGDPLRRSFRVFFAPGLRVHDHMAQAAESLVYANRCMQCAMRNAHFGSALLGTQACADAQLRVARKVWRWRQVLSQPWWPAGAQRDARARLAAAGVHPEQHWSNTLRDTEGAPLWPSATDPPVSSFREPLHQELIGLAEYAHRFTVSIIEGDVAQRAPALSKEGRTRVLSAFDARGTAADAAFDDGATQPTTAVANLSRHVKLTGDKRRDVLVALPVAISTDAFVLARADVRERVHGALSSLLVALEMGRAFAFTQPQLDTYVEAVARSARAFVAAFRAESASDCNFVKLHLQRCHRAQELAAAGAPALRSAQHGEAFNKTLGGDFSASSRRDLAGIAAQLSDREAAGLVGDALALLRQPGQILSRRAAAAPPPLRRSCVLIAPVLVDHAAPLPAAGAAAPVWAAALARNAGAAAAAGAAPVAVLATAHAAAVCIPGRVARPRLDARSDGGVFVILGRRGAAAPRLRELRVARLVCFLSVSLGGGAPRSLAVTRDLVTCTEAPGAPEDDCREARFCREHAFAYLPLRDADASDGGAGRVSPDGGVRVLDFCDPADVLRLAHVMPRARLLPGRAPRAATAPSGDYFAYLGQLLTGATAGPWAADVVADWLPVA